MSDILTAALNYRRRGLSVIPLKRNKLPAIPSWAEYQRDIATEHDIRGWYEAGPNLGVGLVMGNVSGGLGSRDFDRKDTYCRWVRDYPEPARSLPTVETDRGYHVYFRCSAECERAARKQLGKPDSIGAIDFGDGELRIGNCYNAAPPTLRKSGKAYRFLTPLDNLQSVDLFQAGFVALYREDRKLQKTYKGEQGGTPNCDDGRFENSKFDEPANEHRGLSHDIDGRSTSMGGPVSSGNEREDLGYNLGSPASPDKCLPYALDSLSLSVKQQVEQAIERTVPPHWGTRNKLVFAFAREIRGIEEFRGSNPQQFKAIVREWHRRAKPFIKTKTWEATWFDFVKGWNKVKHPKGQEPIAMIYQKVAQLPPPPEAAEYEQPELKMLVSLCRELQRGAGQGPFFLAARTGETLLRVSHTLVADWLSGLCADGVLRLVEKGSAKSKRASRYRYLGRM